MSTARDAFVAFVASAGDVATLKQFAAKHQVPDQQIFEGSVADACEYLKHRTPPAILVVSVPSAEAAPALLDQLANVVDAHTTVVVAGNINEYSFFVWLNNIGIEHYMLTPLKPETVESAYAKITAPKPSADAKEKQAATVIAFMGSKGGVGTSTLGLLTAASIAQNTTANVALVDVNPHDGSLAVLLDIQSSNGFHEALEKPDRIDELLLDRLSQRVNDRLFVISAEEQFSTACTPHSDAPAHLLAALRKKYDVVILDVSHLLNPFSTQLIRMADSRVVVMDASLLALRGALRMAEWFTEAKLPPYSLVVNKTGQYEKHEVAEGDIEKTLKTKASVSFINAPSVAMELDAKLKVLDKKDLPFIRQLTQFALSLAPAHVKPEDAATPAAKKPLLGFLSKR